MVSLQREAQKRMLYLSVFVLNVRLTSLPNCHKSEKATKMVGIFVS